MWLFLNGFKRPLFDMQAEVPAKVKSPHPPVRARRKGLGDLDGNPIRSREMEFHQPKTNSPPPQTNRKEFTSDAAGAGTDSSGRIRCGKVGVKLRWKNLVCIPTVIEQEKFPIQNRWEGCNCQKQKQHRPGAFRWTSVVSSNSRTIEKPIY
jgi:hypothetical protein